MACILPENYQFPLPEGPGVSLWPAGLSANWPLYTKFCYQHYNALVPSIEANSKPILNLKLMAITCGFSWRNSEANWACQAHVQPTFCNSTISSNKVQAIQVCSVFMGFHLLLGQPTFFYQVGTYSYSTLETHVSFSFNKGCVLLHTIHINLFYIAPSSYSFWCMIT
jgi:hypothetical protein